MKIRVQKRKLYLYKTANKEYPTGSIVLAVLFLYLAPFISSWLAVLAMGICLYRVVRFDSRVFAVDYCILAPLSLLSKFQGGVALAIFLALLAGIWYCVRDGIRVNPSFVVLFILFTYLITRMQMNISGFVLCFGQLFVIWVLLPKQDEASAERAIKGFLGSLLFSSVYAWLFRNTSQIRGVRGEAAYVLSGSDITRFEGLCSDPNYYMTLVVIGLALALKLWDSGRMSSVSFGGAGIMLTVFGLLTYSKTFFLMLILLVAVYVVWQFANKKVGRGVLCAMMIAVAVAVVFLCEIPSVEVVLARFRGAENLSDLTTGRTDVYLAYWEVVTADLTSFLFGQGLAAGGLYKDPHNLYLEILYYIGVIGLFLLVTLFGMVIRIIGGSSCSSKQNLIGKYLALFVVLMLYLTLQGLFAPVTYAEFFLAYLAMLGGQTKLTEVVTQGEERILEVERGSLHEC